MNSLISQVQSLLVYAESLLLKLDKRDTNLFTFNKNIQYTERHTISTLGEPVEDQNSGNAFWSCFMSLRIRAI